MARPNIVYIHSHDTGRYIAPHGYAVPTPNLQALAEGGVLFRSNFCCNPTCSASRAALLTGQYPHQNGMHGLTHRGWRLNDYSRHLVHTLRGAGYRSALAGFQHVAPDAGLIGYDEILCGPDKAHDEAVAYLKRDHDQPFFLSVGFTETHRGFPAHAPEDDPRYILPPAPFPDTPETRADMADFHTCARILDRKMGQVFDAIADAGLAENTLVIATTDHGIAFPRMKCTLHDSGIGVFLILRGPGGFSGGRVCDALTSHIDLYPTLCDLLGIDRPAWLEGASIRPWAEGRSDTIRDAVFAELNYHACYEPIRVVRTPRYAYIRRYEDRMRPYLPNCDNSPTKTFWVENGWGGMACRAREELYDCTFDPHQTRNTAADPDAAPLLEEFRARLRTWQEATADPLLTEGWIAPPPGALMNDPHATDTAGRFAWRLSE
ncbi:MAG: sulfatase [Planctomycetota bacterium]